MSRFCVIEIMFDIHSKNPYPSNELSNFAEHHFVIDGVQCASMEGFIQSLRFEEIDIQNLICGLVGKEAKTIGRERDWTKNQVVFWQGKKIRRDSLDYQILIDRAYDSLFNNSVSFREALRKTGDAVLTHTIGHTVPTETLLTQNEFCNRLMDLRKQLNK